MGGSPTFRRLRVARRSLLPQPRLAQAFSDRWSFWITLGNVFDGELGVEFQGLHDRGLRFVNAICHRVGRRENCVRGKGPKPRVDSAVAFIDRIVEMSETYVG